MDWLVSAVIWVILNVARFSKDYLICPLLTFIGWYLVYSAGVLILRALIKIRYQIYNESLKYKLDECRDKTLVITGATSGIGLAATKFLHSQGFTIVACYFSKEEPGYKELEAKIHDHARPNSLYLVELDVKSQESIKQCYRTVKGLLDSQQNLKMHALINVAGVGYLMKFQWQTRETILNLLDTNLKGPIMLTREFMPLLIKNAPHCRLINVSSPLGLLAAEYNTAYAASKAGLIHFSNTLRIDAVRYGIKVVTILPGNIIRNTSILQNSFRFQHKELLASLTDEERQLYDKELSEHDVFKSKMQRAQARQINLTLDTKAKLSRNIFKLFFILAGAVAERNLEDSKIMNSFDNAVRMKDPPRDLYAGNGCFEILVGSSFDMVSHAFLRDWSYFLAKNKISFASAT